MKGCNAETELIRFWSKFAPSLLLHHSYIFLAWYIIIELRNNLPLWLRYGWTVTVEVEPLHGFLKAH
jgi:hypothetical protein